MGIEQDTHEGAELKLFMDFLRKAYQVREIVTIYQFPGDLEELGTHLQSIQHTIIKYGGDFALQCIERSICT